MRDSWFAPAYKNTNPFIFETNLSFYQLEQGLSSWDLLRPSQLE